MPLLIVSAIIANILFLTIELGMMISNPLELWLVVVPMVIQSVCLYLLITNQFTVAALIVTIVLDCGLFYAIERDSSAMNKVIGRH